MGKTQDKEQVVTWCGWTVEHVDQAGRTHRHGACRPAARLEAGYTIKCMDQARIQAHGQEAENLSQVVACTSRHMIHGHGHKGWQGL